ncbi:hypothetical protein BURK1_00332 [Burkholderiales bacterium]|nr:hypothetical protein BURK1_00332 [Burkholderiales bacterium]
MKRIVLFTVLAAVLGGCAVVPIGYGHRDGYYRDGYYRDRDYQRDGTWRDRNYDRRDGYYGGGRYPGWWGYRSDPYRDYGR